MNPYLKTSSIFFVLGVIFITILLISISKYDALQSINGLLVQAATFASLALASGVGKLYTKVVYKNAPLPFATPVDDFSVFLDLMAKAGAFGLALGAAIWGKL